ncbi:MAG: hypothetical protein M3Q58_03000 [Bacteroidota bacterium]|nr:hypothetical protein [Bacteroidota bacterium]
MFSKLLIPKVIIVLAAAYYIYTPFDISDKSYILNGYTDKMSVYTGDSIDIFIEPNKDYKKAYFVLYDVLGNRIDTIASPADKQTINTNYPWSEGFKYHSTFSYTPSDNIESGIYLWEKKIPFVIKSRKPADIVIVYPFNTINLYSNAGGKSFYAYNSSEDIASDTLSFERPFTIGLDSYLKDFFLWIGGSEFNVKYVADIDLDDSSTYNYAKILILAGVSNAWTTKARENFDNYISNGGNALILSANTMFWNVRYNETKDKVIVYKECGNDPIKKDPSCSFNDKNFNIKNSIITNYMYGGDAQVPNSFQGFKIINDNSPILKGTNIQNEDTLKINNRFVDGLLIQFNNKFSRKKITILDPGFFKYYRKEIIGVEMAAQEDSKKNGVFIIAQKTKKSGIIINTSSSDWCSSKGIGGKDSLNIRKITSNMINLLLNEQNVFSPK